MPKPSADSNQSTYQNAGVDLAAGEKAVMLMKDAVTGTYGPQVLAGIGSFGGLYDISELGHLAQPVLVASTDGVGTKTKVAAALNDFAGIGQDIVNHCINDILVQGAKPLFFLDYVAASKLEPEMIATIVSSAATACKQAGIALLGGETAEMPGVYAEGEFDLVGTIVGIVDREKIITGQRIKAGDQVLALMSGGLQTNGFSLARQVFGSRLLEPFGQHTIGQELLTPHRSYLDTVKPLLTKGLTTGMAHITGGGISGNLPRILPQGLAARIKTGSWPVPEIFKKIQTEGKINDTEMYRVFNMGAGFLLVVAAEQLETVLQQAPETLYHVGEIITGDGVSFV